MVTQLRVGKAGSFLERLMTALERLESFSQFGVERFQILDPFRPLARETLGVPFGSYDYSGELGPKLAGVPLIMAFWPLGQ